MEPSKSNLQNIHISNQLINYKNHDQNNNAHIIANFLLTFCDHIYFLSAHTPNYI